MSDVFKEGNLCKTCGNTKRYKVGSACVVCAKLRSLERAKKRIKGVWKHRLSHINTETKTAHCSNCGVVAIVKKGPRWKCKIARNEQRGCGLPETRRAKWQRYYRKIKGVPKQTHCDICGEEKPLCWDHDHKTGQHRGWLCHGCNVGIGFLHDDISNLKAAITYLERSNHTT